MAIRVALHHKTSYQFERLVSLSPHEVRLKPATHSRTPILSYSLTVMPKDHFVNWQQDTYGNYIARISVDSKGNIPVKNRCIHSLLPSGKFCFTHSI